MIRRYCDCCKAEMVNVVGVREGLNKVGDMTATIDRNGAQLTVSVIHCANGAAARGDVCKYCILDALYELDDRPKIGAPDRYGELAEALGCECMDSHEGRIDIAKRASTALNNYEQLSAALGTDFQDSHEDRIDRARRARKALKA